MFDSAFRKVFRASASAVFARFSLLFLLFLSLLTPLQAQNVATKAPDPASDAAPIIVDGRRLFDVGPDGDSSAAQRATRVNRRLQNLIEGETDVPAFSPDNVTVEKGEQVITLGKVAVLSVTDVDADDAGQDIRDLALLHGAAMSRAVRDARATRQNPLRGAGILISNSLRDLVNSFLRWLPRVFAAILLTVFFWIAAKIARKLTRNATKRLGFDPNLRALLLALSFYGVWFVGLLAILSSLGLDSGSLAAAVGVSGFVLGFAFKDILSHFLAGILLLVSGKFRIGDEIVVRDFEGTVERIELRAMELRTYDNRLVIIPNADVFTAPIISNTASPHRRRSFTLPLPPHCDIDHAQEIIVEAMVNTPGVLHDPAPDVVIDDLTADGVLLRARFSTNSIRSDYVRVGGECMKNVQLAFQQAKHEQDEKEADAEKEVEEEK